MHSFLVLKEQNKPKFNMLNQCITTKGVYLFFKKQKMLKFIIKNSKDVFIYVIML